MSVELFPGFLVDELIYAEVEQHWVDLWMKIHPEIRRGWEVPWFGPDPLMDANPIFTAIHRGHKRAIRVLQADCDPKKPHNFVAYIDTAGPDDEIMEMVISCTLTELTSRMAFGTMIAWVAIWSSNVLV